MTPTELREMYEKATIPPWQRSGESIIQVKHITRDVWHIPKTTEDLDLIVAMHAALPALLDAAEAAEDLHKIWLTEPDHLWYHRAAEATGRLSAALARLAATGGEP